MTCVPWALVDSLSDGAEGSGSHGGCAVFASQGTGQESTLEPGLGPRATEQVRTGLVWTPPSAALLSAESLLSESLSVSVL